MPTPSKGYKLADGTKVPSVTQVLGRFKDSGALIGWAHKMGLEGKNYREVAKIEADIGSQVHRAIETDLDPMFTGPVATGWVSYQKFIGDYRGSIVQKEVGLVSEILRVGGTVDAVGESDSFVVEEYEILDWKTSKRIYPDAVIQVAAYRRLWNENNPARRIEKCRIVRFGKEKVEYEQFIPPAPMLAKAEFLFCIYREAFDLSAEIEEEFKPKHAARIPKSPKGGTS